MPEGLIDTFNADEILDLVAYPLLSRRPAAQDVSQETRVNLGVFCVVRLKRKDGNVIQ